MDRILFNFILAIEGVLANKLRTFLTALGIIFGVAAVIAMLSIGTGAKQSILDQMKLIGTNNIVIESVILTEEQVATADNNNSTESELMPWSPGLTLDDAQAITGVVPTVDQISPEIVISTNVIQAAKMEKAKCVGVTNAFFELNNLDLHSGMFFHDHHLEGGKPVCIIGKNIATKFFSQGKVLGQKIKCGNTWLTIIGVLEKRNASKESLENLGIRDYNSDVYVPVSTALLRFKNRSMVSREDIKQGEWDDEIDKTNNYHQLDRLVIRVDDSKYLQASADVIGKILKRRHHGLLDYELSVPELLLQQQQKTQEIFNNVLAMIAGISLLVGGIGIMNIMLASVMERIKEIGVRRSLGAKQNDIILQFLFEAVFISLIGGCIGIVLGIFSANVIADSFGIPAIVSTWSVLLSFGVAAMVGLVFGLFPAQKAALQDPILALRTE